MKNSRTRDERVFLRLLAGLVLLAVVPPIIIGYIIYSINRTDHMEHTASLMRSLAADRELAARLLIEKQRDALGFLAADSNTVLLAQELHGSRVSDTDFLGQMVRRSPFFSGLLVADIETGIRFSKGGFPKEMAELGMSEARLFPGSSFIRTGTLANGERALLIGQPVAGPRTKTVMLGLGRLNMLTGLFKDWSMLGETGESFLSDPEGVALTPLRYSEHAQMGHPIDASAMLDCLKGNSSDFVITPDYMGEPTAMSYKPVQGFGGCVMVHMRPSEIISPANTIRNMVAAVIAVIVFSVALLSTLSVRKLVRMGKVRRELEDDLASHACSMEEMVAERTRQLENEIKDRVAAEELLRDNKAFLENIVHNVHEAIFKVMAGPDNKMSLVWMNANAERMTGLRSCAASGRSLGEVFGDAGERLSEHFSECVEKGVVRFEEAFQTPDGQRLLLMTFAPLKDESGRTAGIICSAMDITEIKQLEGEMLKAQKLESLGVLAGGIAHDFNNFLAIIRLNATLLKAEAGLTPEKAELLDTIDKSTALAANLTNQLLTFAKGGKPVKKAIPTAGLLTDLAGFSLRGTQATCSVDLEDELFDMDGDSGQISQVINNLLINAAQAMPSGGVVTLSAANFVLATPAADTPLAPGKYVKITIADEGEGIQTEYLPRIFDPYFTTKQKGSGLGLASAYSIIRNHSGHISVKSAPGQGATFEVFIPGLSQSARAAAKTSEVPVADTGKKVLVMDDDDLVRRSVCTVLDFLGYSFVACPDGAEAVEQYAKAIDDGQPFDAVILDLTVPGGMGGEEAAARILAIDLKAKVFVSSGYSDSAVIADYKAFGFCGVLRKPYDAPELGRKLRAALEGSKT